MSLIFFFTFSMSFSFFFFFIGAGSRREYRVLGFLFLVLFLVLFSPHINICSNIIRTWDGGGAEEGSAPDGTYTGWMYITYRTVVAKHDNYIESQAAHWGARRDGREEDTSGRCIHTTSLDGGGAREKTTGRACQA